MPKPTPKNRRTLIAAWAVLCVAGLAATSALGDSSAQDSDPKPGQSVSAQCSERIAEIDKQLAKLQQEQKQDGEEEGKKVAGFASIQVGTEDDCSDAIHEHLDAIR